MSDTNEKFDYIIIGAGVAGLASAQSWRFKNSCN